MMPFLFPPFQEFDSLVTYMAARSPLLPMTLRDPISMWGLTLVSVLLVAAACSGLGLLRILFIHFLFFVPGPSRLESHLRLF
jgi:hypothetical protein